MPAAPFSRERLHKGLFYDKPACYRSSRITTYTRAYPELQIPRQHFFTSARVYISHLDIPTHPDMHIFKFRSVFPSVFLSFSLSFLSFPVLSFPYFPFLVLSFVLSVCLSVGPSVCLSFLLFSLRFSFSLSSFPFLALPFLSCWLLFFSCLVVSCRVVSCRVLSLPFPSLLYTFFLFFLGRGWCRQVTTKRSAFAGR